MQAGARRAFAMAQRLDAWFAQRQEAANAARVFDAMSDHQLNDIGLTRGEAHRLAWTQQVDIESRP
jgi:uncharacterized protein YjiS (DUF1127 family)